MNPSNWSQVGVGVAALGTLVYVVNTLRKMVAETNKQFGNHLSNMTKALENLVVNTAMLNERVDRLHDDNVRVESALSAADARRERD